MPTPAAARGGRQSSYDKLLKKHRIRRIDAATLTSRLGQRPLDVDPASARAAETHVHLLARRLAVVKEQIASAEARTDEILAELGGAVPAPADDGDPQPGQSEEQRDATILRSMPGVGGVVLARASARRCSQQADDALRRRDYHALRCLCGAAPVTRQSYGHSSVWGGARLAFLKQRNPAVEPSFGTPVAECGASDRTRSATASGPPPSRRAATRLDLVPLFSGRRSAAVPPVPADPARRPDVRLEHRASLWYAVADDA